MAVAVVATVGDFQALHHLYFIGNAPVLHYPDHQYMDCPSYYFHSSYAVKLSTLRLSVHAGDFVLSVYPLTMLAL